MTPLLLFYLSVAAAGHGAMNRPAPRNNAGRQEFKANVGCAGQSCLWYQVGCANGCKCSGEGKQMYPTPAAMSCYAPKEPTLPDQFRTWNIDGKSGQGDWGKYMPWRSPGSSIPLNSCGVASGFSKPNPYNQPAPSGHKPGDEGSDLPPLAGQVENWQAGAIANVSFGLMVNHGGGYQYRLCPKSNGLTEECFQSMPLEFATDMHTVVYEDGSYPDLRIPATDVAEGTTPAGSSWRRNPIPACNCDLALCGSGKGDFAEPYAQQSGYGPWCPTGVQFKPPFEGGVGYTGFSFSIMDELKVPRLEGEYVLQWRWDCEQTAQIWNSCADITISSRPPSPGPGPVPGPTTDYMCWQGKCYEKPGYGTMDKETCDKTCSEEKGHFVCWQGKCYEKPGFGTKDKETCDKTCSAGKGAYVCWQGKCYEKPGLGHLEKEDCENACSQLMPGHKLHGWQSGKKADFLCYQGKCFEKPGYGNMEKEECEHACTDLLPDQFHLV